MRIPLPYLYGSVLVGLFACLWAFTFAEHLIAAEDGALYYVLGKALYLGEEYVSINTPMATPVNSPHWDILLSSPRPWPSGRRT